MTSRSTVESSAFSLSGEDTTREHDDLLKELAASGVVAPETSVRPLQLVNDVKQPADAPSRSLILDYRNRPLAVLFLSSGVSAGLMARNLSNAREAGKLLGPDLGSVILEPTAAGTFQGRSYAVWPWRHSLSRFRAWAYVQKWLLRSAILDWMCESTSVTKRIVDSTSIEIAYGRPLSFVMDGPFSQTLRDAASRSLHRLNTGVWVPRCFLEHGDWWLGNVLLPATSEEKKIHPRGFILIDWGGARLNGYPFVDLLRYARSAALSRDRLKREVARHLAAVGCEPEDALGYLLAGTGSTVMNVEHFAIDRFCRVAEANYTSLDEAMR